MVTKSELNLHARPLPGAGTHAVSFRLLYFLGAEVAGPPVSCVETTAFGSSVPEAVARLFPAVAPSRWSELSQSLVEILPLADLCRIRDALRESAFEGPARKHAREEALEAFWSRVRSVVE